MEESRMAAVITTLRLGRSIEDRSGNLYMTDPGVKMEMAFNAAAIEAGGKRILVDTGIQSLAMYEEYAPCMQDDYETLEGALAMVGWRPEDVDIVINTHLHFDHCGQNSRFPQARFVVQKAEREAAHHPIQTQVTFYLPELFDPPAVSASAWIVVDGEFEVAPGVRVIATPGHSAGHQSVVVETAEGAVVYSGDVANLLENLTRDIPAAILIDVPRCLESMEKVRQAGRFVIPSHDTTISPGRHSGFPPMPPKPETVDRLRMG
jgi:N-acyl homoserine lactone hydrolase